ncbi:Hint domain-containing protein [Rhodobacter sp. NSM]|uniref:Hint domain-containing protein n=1 Tax=Rhodobacter sp. NSM TaxID=3457501 RepID=UPI003FD29547
MFMKIWHGDRLTVRWVPDEDAGTAGAEGIFPDRGRILTETGPQPVASLVPGDRLWCKGDRFLPVLAVDRRILRPEPLADPRLWPIWIAPDALGADQPARLLVVSPDQRMVLSGASTAEGMLPPEVSVPAVALVNGRSIRQRPLEAPLSVTRLFLSEALCVQVDNLLLVAARRRALLGCDAADDAASARGARGRVGEG